MSTPVPTGGTKPSEAVGNVSAGDSGFAALRKSVGTRAIGSVAEIERLIAWAAAEPVPSVDTASDIPGEAQLEPSVLWCLATQFERAQAPERALGILASPRLATADAEIEAFRLLTVARLELACGRLEKAAASVRQAINLAERPGLIRKAANLVDRILREGGNPPAANCRLALLGDATFSGYVAPLKAFAFARRVGLELHLGGFGQQFQELQSPESDLARFKPTVVVLAMTWRSLGLAEEEGNPDLAVLRAVDSCKELWSLARKQGASLVVQHNFEIPETSAYGNLSTSLAGGRGTVLRRINAALAAEAAVAGGVAILDIEHLAGSIGKRTWADDRMWTAAKHYPSAAATVALARHQIAMVRATHGSPSKCLVLDLDNTLWGGVIGEDGLDGIALGGAGSGEAYTGFQRYVKSLAQRGVLLAVCSKNDDAAARSPFLEHSEMVLKLDDISAFVANWRPKHENILQIASDLNIGVDSLVFIDDNPAERMSVRGALPEVEVPEMGSDPSQFATIIARSLAFEALSVTAEDRGRAASYKTATARRELESTSASLDDYLARLGMALKVVPIDEGNLPRAVQLIGKTNQFNVLTSRKNTADVRRYMDGDSYARVVRLADQFTDHGITGLMLARRSGDILTIDEWLLSCRILGRRVDEAMFAAVWNFAHLAGCRALNASYQPTAKNGQVADLYDRLGMSRAQESDGVKFYTAIVDAPRELPSCFASIEYSEVARVG